MMLWSLKSRARRGPYVTEGRKQLPPAISALSLRPELQTAPAAGAFPAEHGNKTPGLRSFWQVSYHGAQPGTMILL